MYMYMCTVYIYIYIYHTILGPVEAQALQLDEQIHHPQRLQSRAVRHARPIASV